MLAPPLRLDGARVLYWAIATDLPFDYWKQGAELFPLTGFAVGRFDFSECYQLFCCGPGWRALSDFDVPTLAEALGRAARLARGQALSWVEVK